MGWVSNFGPNLGFPPKTCQNFILKFNKKIVYVNRLYNKQKKWVAFKMWFPI